VFAEKEHLSSPLRAAGLSNGVNLLTFGRGMGFTLSWAKNGPEQAFKMIEKWTFLSYKILIGESNSQIGGVDYGLHQRTYPNRG
jgi:hypothetical protein